MKAATAIGIGVALVALALGATMEGSKLPAFFNIPAMLIVFGGLIGVTLASCGIDALKAIPQLYKKAMGGDKQDLNAQLELLVGFAERARREGLLALDEEVNDIEDEFTRKGLQLVVDGTDPELVREILENEIDGMAARHHAGAIPFEKAGGFAPTLGIIGTVLGLVHVLENLSEPDKLGHLIAGAFLATLWGVLSANVMWLPIGAKLKRMNEVECHHMEIVLEGVISVQAGSNPRIIEQKLLSLMGTSPERSDLAEAA